MRLFNRSKEDKADTTTPEVKTEENTPSDSETPSVADNEKKELETTQEVGDAPSQSKAEDENVAEKKADTGEEEEEDDETRYPKAMKLTLVTVALCLAVFCMALDNTIIATAIPRITDEFHAINDVSTVY
jgi:type IV secretory pathway VirB10-like protein